MRQARHSYLRFSRWFAALAAVSLLTLAVFGGTSAATPGVTFHVTVSTQTTVAGTAIDFTVTVVAGNALAAANYAGTVTFTSTDTQASLPADYTFNPGDHGKHVFSAGVTFKTAGSQTVTATEQGDNSTTGTSPTVDVSPAPVDHFLFAAPTPSPVVAGVQSSMTVSAFDQYGNPSTSGLSPAGFTHANLDGSNVGCDPDPCTASATLGAFDGSGVATATFTAYKAEGGGTLTVTAANNASTTSDPFAVTAAPVDHFEYGALSPSTLVAGVPSTMTVSAFDQYENPSTNDLTPVSFPTTMGQSGEGCSGPCTPAVSLSTPFDANGVGAVTLTGYKAETGRTVTVTAQDGKGTDSPVFDVNPAPVDHFLFGSPSPSPVVAGVQSSMSVSAFDHYGNASTSGLSPAALTHTNLDGSNVGCGAHPCTVSATLGAFDGSGVATATFTAYKAEGGGTLTVTATNSASSTSDPFAVTAAPVDHFEYGVLSPSTVVAGVPSTMSVSAFDQYENASANDLTPVSLSTTMHQSSQGCSGPCTPAVTVSTPFDANGVGAVTLTGYKAETGRTVTVTAQDGKGTNSPAFTVFSGPPATVTFTKQPTQAEAEPGANCADGNNCIISYPQGVQVQANDAFGNLANHDASVTLTIDAGHNPGSGALSNGNPGTTLPTDSNGLATFTTLTINNVGIGYELLATGSPQAANSTPTTLSNAFIIAQKVATCSNACSPSTTTATTTLNVAATGTGSTTLGIALVQGGQQPAGVCGSFRQAAGSPESFVNLTSTAGVGNLVLTITWTLPTSIVNAQPDNGAAHYNICLGAVNLTNPTNTPPMSGFPIKAPAACPSLGGQVLSTACPVLDPAFGVTFFWGVLPDCKNAKTIANPCVLSRTKDPAGDLIFKFAVEYPWDPNGSLG